MPYQNTYAPIHTHSAAGSHLDGMIKIPELFQFCKDNSIPAFAITDHGTMAAVAEIAKVSKQFPGVKPIYGFEAYLANDHRIKDKTQPRYHLVLLAKNDIGLKNLLKLTSLGFTEGFYYKPRISFELLEQYNEGVICATACAGGPVSQCILKDDESAAYFMTNRLKAIFGKDLYLEMQPTREVWQQKINKAMINVSQVTGVPLIITPDSHYLRKEDFHAHEVMLCIQTKGVMSDPTGDEIAVASSEDSDETGTKKKRFSFKVPDYFVYTADDIYQYFDEFHSEIPKVEIHNSLSRTLEIADMCNASYELGQDLYPNFEIDRNLRKFKQFTEWQKGVLVKDLLIEPAWNLQ